MKKYKNLLDIVLLLGLATLTAVALAPKKLVMPTSLQMIILCAVIVLLGGFMALVWREDPADEREAENQSDASRVGYLVGVAVLIASLAYKSIAHHDVGIEPLALMSMIGAKILIQRHRDK
jgi:hypothetical protein